MGVIFQPSILSNMPFLNKGKWTIDDSKRPENMQQLASAFNNWITKDGSAGKTGIGGFKAESGRYHVYIGKGCPFANRVTMMMQLKGLFEQIGVTYTAPQMYQDNRWGFVSEPGYKDDLYGKEHLYEIYNHLAPGCTTVVSVPLVIDKIDHKIVSNDSASIMEMFNTAFNDITGNHDDYFKQTGIKFNDTDKGVQDVCIGVYRMPFSPTDESYKLAFEAFFDTVDQLDAHLAEKKFVHGADLSGDDLMLFSTLIRFDVAYYFLYHANKQRMSDYSHISRWLHDVYNFGGIKETVFFDHIKKLYYGNKDQNPSGRVPLGPANQFE